MPKQRRLNDSEIKYETGQDAKVLAALDDAIAAIYHFGEDKVNLDNLKSVIVSRLSAIASRRVEAEGLDGEVA